MVDRRTFTALLRAFWMTDFEGKKGFAGGEDPVAVFAVDQATGEPKLIQKQRPGLE